LDEVDSMPIALQAKLLRIIQKQEVQVVGEDRKRKFNIKIVCAASTDISSNGTRNQFREDLYYRISRGIIRLPALREMKESIVDLSQDLIEKISKKIGYDKNVRINKRAVKKLKSYDWPGNIRELENVLYRALKNMILEGDNVLNYNHIENLDHHEETSNELEKFFADKTHEDIEKMYMGYIFDKAGKNKAKAMRLCGFNSKSPIHRLVKKYKLMQ
jgi:DNA-binding NtrC family response regulator